MWMGSRMACGAQPRRPRRFQPFSSGLFLLSISILNRINKISKIYSCMHAHIFWLKACGDLTITMANIHYTVCWNQFFLPIPFTCIGFRLYSHFFLPLFCYSCFYMAVSSAPVPASYFFSYCFSLLLEKWKKKKNKYSMWKYLNYRLRISKKAWNIEKPMLLHIYLEHIRYLDLCIRFHFSAWTVDSEEKIDRGENVDCQVTI